jgi:hypothetical protein
VKVTFLDGKVREIFRGQDDVFRCNCSKVFQHPLSLLRHAKHCYGVELETYTQLSSIVSVIDDDITEVEDLGVCIGIWFRNIH